MAGRGRQELRDLADAVRLRPLDEVAPLLPSSRIAPNRVIARAAALVAELLPDRPERLPVPLTAVPVGLQQALELADVTVQLRIGLGLAAIVAMLRRLATDHLAHGVPGQPQLPGHRPDRPAPRPGTSCESLQLSPPPASSDSPANRQNGRETLRFATGRVGQNSTPIPPVVGQNCTPLDSHMSARGREQTP